jgi:hypothetical protein
VQVSISSHLIVDNLKNGEMIDEDSIDKLKEEKDSVVCFMSCAYIDNLIDSFKNIIK